MATAAMDVSALNTAPDAEALATADFQALEQRVMRAVELLRAERDAHSAANARIAELERHSADLEHQLTVQQQQRSELEQQHGALEQRRTELEQRRTELEHRLNDIEQQLGGKSEHAQRLEGELEHLQQERDQVRGRVERLLRHLDEFTA